MGGTKIGHNYKGLFEDWEIRITLYLVRKFKGSFDAFRKDDEADLVQECLVHWLFVKGGYSCPESELEKILFIVIRNKLINLLEKSEANLRKIGSKSIPFEELFDQDSKFSNTLTSENADALDELTRLELPTELMRVVDGLSLKQKQLCKLLGEAGLNIYQISKHLNLPRTTIYDEISRIREIFKKEGLQEYLD